MSQPDYIRTFQRPPHTEIKRVGNGWYLYGYETEYDPVSKRTRKKNRKYLGRITEEGFLPKGEKPKRQRIKDVVEIGATQYCWERTSYMRSELKRLMPDVWRECYVLAVLRALGTVRFKRIQSAYEDSFLSVLLPGLALSAASLTRLLENIGRNRATIHEYLKNGIQEEGEFILIDGHRLLSASKGMITAEVGYDSKMRYKPQINLLYAFTKSDRIGQPAYYEQHTGSIVDVTAFSHLIKSAGILSERCMVIGDKGCASEEVFEALVEQCLWYCMPLKRGNRYVKGKVPARDEYETIFLYNDRPVYAQTFAEDGFNVHIYLDELLHADELRTLTSRIDEKNTQIARRRHNEEERRKKGRPRLSDEEFENLTAEDAAVIAAQNKEMGTITLRTNNTALSAQQCYTAYKQRQMIEAFFKIYDCTLGYNASYVRNSTSEEGWLFLNHLSACIAIDALNEISALGLTASVSWRDVREMLQKVRVSRIDDHWDLIPIKKSVSKLLDKLHISEEHIMQFVTV